MRRFAAINTVLATFVGLPEIYPTCYETSAALTIRQVDRGSVMREEHVDLLLPADR